MNSPSSLTLLLSSKCRKFVPSTFSNPQLVIQSSSLKAGRLTERGATFLAHFETPSLVNPSFFVVAGAEVSCVTICASFVLVCRSCLSCRSSAVTFYAVTNHQLSCIASRRHHAQLRPVDPANDCCDKHAHACEFSALTSSFFRVLQVR